MERKVRIMFGSDIIILAFNLDSSQEEDKRNERAAELIKKASMIYMGGGKQYEELVQDVANNAFKEYHEWYTQNIFNVVMNNPVHFMDDGDRSNTPKYDVNKYDLGKYFDGLNKGVFEELQKLILYLNNPKSGESFRIASTMSEDDTSFPEHTKDFFILAHSILVASLEGSEFLDRIEKIFRGYELSEKENESIKYQIIKNLFIDPSSNESDRMELEKRLTVKNLVNNFLSNPPNN